jgi:hypothetical protein
MNPEFEPTNDQIQNLVSYLLSLGEGDDVRLLPLASPETGELDFDPDLCRQFQ